MKRLLVANRGEIAIRIIRAARDLGLETVAVYSAADEHAPHVRLADRAVAIGPAHPSKSYLRTEVIVDAAREAGADAIHPGYGFLSERASFAQACRDAALTFVGPSPEVIGLMGDKAKARETARKAGVPTVPGSDGPVAKVDQAAAEAGQVGYPVLIKAAAGGGGRGIRVAADEAELRAQFPLAAAEAGGAFGDPSLYLERFLTRSRHVEVQVMGDGADAVHFYERECSLQRRRQKVVEEAPSPGIDDEVRAGVTDAAVRLCRHVGYSGAGTVEMLVDDRTGEFFFMEMNTRIQVEHPITEAVCGVDLVAEQLRVAAGAGLSLGQSDIAVLGAALEVRVCAEDPAAGFLPCPGRVDGVRLPAGPWVRVDTWLEPGAEVTPFYDSLLAKVVTWGDARPAALVRARRALAECEITGVATTVPVLAQVLEEPWFERAEFDTGTLEEWLASRPAGEKERPEREDVR